MKMLRALFQTPLKTLIVFLLLVATSFALTSSIISFAVKSIADKHIIDTFEGVGMVETEAPKMWGPGVVPVESINFGYDYPAYSRDIYLYTDERVTSNPYGADIEYYRYRGLSKSDVERIGSLPYVTSASVRYMTAGISKEIFRIAANGYQYDFLNRFIMDATLIGIIASSRSSIVENSLVTVRYENNPALYDIEPPETFEMASIAFGMRDRKLLVGDKNASGYIDRYPSTMAFVARGHIFGQDFNNQNGYYIYEEVWADKTSNVNHFGNGFENDIYKYDFLNNLGIDERYVIIGRYLSDPGSPLFFVGDSSTFDVFPQIYPLSGYGDDYLDQPEFASLKKLLQITTDDLHTLDVVYTDDMSYIPRFDSGDMEIIGGRMLTSDDNGKSVCVMSDSLMTLNNLKLGDKIKLKLGDKLFEQNAVIGAIASVPERYPDKFTEAEFEIVGVYKDTDKLLDRTVIPHKTYSSSTVFVPLSFLPVEVPDAHIVKPGEFTFLIGDPRDIPAFLSECAPIIEGELGLTLSLGSGAWSDIMPKFEGIDTQDIVFLALFALLFIAVVIFAVYILIIRKRDAYDEMCLQGEKALQAALSIFKAVLILSFTALLIGNILAFVFDSGSALSILEPFKATGLETDSSTLVLIATDCFIGGIVLIAIAEAIGLRVLMKKKG